MPNYTSNVRNENDGHDVKEINASNHLSTEKSPYLLQHKDNPVHWYPWGDLAFDKAERENKPIFLSIGYSTCHWCHVMAHESFEDDEVARLLNDDFVAVKVDREERPDIDQVYMTVCQLVTGGGGWPLSIIMTPEKKPFFADTYIPKTDRYGKAGMLRLLPHISNLWKNNREQANAAAAEIARAVQGSAMRTNKSGIVAGNTESLDESVLHASFESFAQRFDEEHGGFGDAPKFPSPHNLLFLLQYAQRTENKDAQKMVERTLQKMRMGGIYDHIGFGFHRYATDRNWLVPHFEKMLYDQAMLLMTYTTAFQITGKPEYRKTAEEIIEYVLRDMTDPEGGFYSAEDADSEGEEGKFYVWTVDEIDSISGRNESEIGDADAALFREFYPLSPEGNFRDESTGKMTGSNIIHLEKPLVERVSEVATEQGLDENEILMQLESMRKTLFEAREKRIRPHLDDKVLTDWNGLMIAALAQAGQVFNDAKFISAAQEAAVFILSRMRGSDGRLLHRYRDGDAAILANLDDHAFMIWGLLELYGSTFDVMYLKEAISIADDMVAHFHDRNDDADESSPTSGKGGFFFTPDDGEELLTRSKEAYDGAIPSGNAVAITVLLRLARLTGRTDFEDIASAALRRFSHEISRLPTAHTQSLIALDFALGPSHEIVVVGDPASDAARSMLDSLRSVSSRNSVVLFKNSSEGTNDLDEIAPFTAAMDMIDGKCTAYVCSGFACTLPTTDPKKMQELLGAD